jgi:hypothetical protein
MAMFVVAGNPSMLVVVAVVIVIPIPLASFDYTAGGETDESQQKAAAQKASCDRRSWILHVIYPFFLIQCRETTRRSSQ